VAERPEPPTHDEFLLGVKGNGVFAVRVQVPGVRLRAVAFRFGYGALSALW
jgi:hypothetical protein